jgi:hypothetical protein
LTAATHDAGLFVLDAIPDVPKGFVASWGSSLNSRGISGLEGVGVFYFLVNGTAVGDCGGPLRIRRAGRKNGLW